jgi:hypothetical protein
VLPPSPEQLQSRGVSCHGIQVEIPSQLRSSSPSCAPSCSILCTARTTHGTPRV